MPAISVPMVSLRLLCQMEPIAYQSLPHIYHNLGPAGRPCSPENLYHKRGPCSSKNEEGWQVMLTVREEDVYKCLPIVSGVVDHTAFSATVTKAETGVLLHDRIMGCSLRWQIWIVSRDWTTDNAHSPRKSKTQVRFLLSLPQLN